MVNMSFKNTDLLTRLSSDTIELVAAAAALPNMPVPVLAIT
jgi:hypothetical protein